MGDSKDSFATPSGRVEPSFELQEEEKKKEDEGGFMKIFKKDNV